MKFLIFFVAVLVVSSQVSANPARHECEYNLWWWCKNHAEDPRQDEDRADAPQTTTPDPAPEPRDPEPRDPVDPPRCD